MRNKIVLRIFLIVFFMLFMSITTINILYKNINISNTDYLKIILNDSYNSNYYNKFIEFISNKFNPLNIITDNKKFNLSNRININPIVYIYNKDQSLNYKKELNISPSIMFASYYLSEELNKNGIESIFESNNIIEFSNNNNITAHESLDLFMNDKISNYKLKYIVELGMSDINNIKFNNNSYAFISLYANRYNISKVTKLNNLLNLQVPNISKIYFDDESNKNMKIDIGTNKSSMLEVVRSIKVLSYCFKEIIDE